MPRPEARRTTCSQLDADPSSPLSAALLVAMLLLAGCDWTQFRYGPEHTGFNAFETTIGPANVSGVRLRWSQSVGTQGITFADDDRQRRGVCGCGGQALRVRRQHRKRTLVIRGNRGSALCSLGRERCRVRQHGQNGLYALDATTGAKLLVVDRRRQRSDGRERCRVRQHATAGSTRWTPQPERNAGHRPPEAALRRSRTVSCTSARQSELDALDATTGAKLWSNGLGHRDEGVPAVANGVVYVGTDDGGSTR